MTQQTPPPTTNKRIPMHSHSAIQLGNHKTEQAADTMKSTSAASSLFWLSVVVLQQQASAFSSITPTHPNPSNRRTGVAVPTPNQGPSTTAHSVVDTAPWRITLDIGREPLANMPFEWARSGCRLPLSIPCQFENHSPPTSKQQRRGVVRPQKSTVAFTGPDGEVVRPIQAGQWELQTSKRKSELRFTLTMPESMERRDVSIDAGTTLELIGTAYTQEALDECNQAFYRARETTWQVGGELNEMVKRQDAAKKWNTETNQWEKRYPDENPLSFAQKQLRYWKAKREQEKANSQRPDPNDISERGLFPGVEGGFYVAQKGVVRCGKNGPVMGTWYAQPITTQPVSYRK